MTRALVVGASGALGGAIAAALAADGADVVGTSRAGGDGLAALDPLAQPATLPGVAARGPFDAVVWAQGANVNDAADDLDLDAFRAMLEANVTFVAASMSGLLDAGAIRDGARLVVLSSIWEHLARAGKFSYTVSKAAVGGLVRAASVDLAPRGILVNAVAPSVIDTPMTRAMLPAESVERVAGQTGFGRLATPEDVAALVAHLCSERNTGVSGQSIAVDLGFSHARVL
jgi:3-oxoacyl-[acyl-carrier protein] reductase